MMGLSDLGVVHTLISLYALVVGIFILVRYRYMNFEQRVTQSYVVATALAAVTALGLFRHGGFGPAHGLAILTLVALLIGVLANCSTLFGRFSRYVQAIGFSSTLLFHLIPGVTETLTRLPASSPVLSSPEAPEFKPIYGVILLVFLIGITIQLRWLRQRDA